MVQFKATLSVICKLTLRAARWLNSNKQWLFSGVAVALIIAAANMFTHSSAPISVKEQNHTDGNLELEIRITNQTPAEERISSLIEYIITESQGLMVHEYPGGRIEATPLDGTDDFVVGPGTSRAFTIRLDNTRWLYELLKRGSANINFVVHLENGGFLFESAPFITSTFHNKYLALTLME